ncbi:MAG TPA: quinol:electron acceptor oxidoreductase subunit ActD [Vicinamibacterales bacterium]|jgi:hypothetical protein
MSAIYGLYGQPASAQRAVDELRSLGLQDGDITVISAEPLEHWEFGQMNHASRIWYVASAGGFLGLISGAWLTRMTELAWPLPTGNMPIVAWWPNLIVVFELTMLGAILATVATLIVAGGLLRRKPVLYDRAVADGQILVGTDNAAGKSDAIEKALSRVGAASVKKV